jgi:hypothetical protein
MLNNVRKVGRLVLSRTCCFGVFIAAIIITTSTVLNHVYRKETKIAKFDGLPIMSRKTVKNCCSFKSGTAAQ